MRKEATLPATLLALAPELERVIREEPETLKVLSGGAAAFVKLTKPESDPHAALWLLALQFVALDLAMGLEGKRPAVLAPIAPMWNPSDRKSVFDLPNEAVGTFAGFMSPTAQCYTLAAGRHCATRFLIDRGLVPKATPLPKKPQWDDETETLFRKEVRHGLKHLLDRVKSIIDDANLIPIFDGLVAKGIVKGLRRSILDGLQSRHEIRRVFELRLRLPWHTFQLVDPSGGDDLITRTKDRGRSLARMPRPDMRSGRATRKPLGWLLKAGQLVVHENSRHDFCHVKLPPLTKVKRALTLANPVFWLNIEKNDAPPHRMRPATQIGAKRWELLNDVVPLEKALVEDSDSEIRKRPVFCK